MAERIPLFYTFGNHHHWVDMEWLWGYKVTPDSVRDMLGYCKETGAKGNVNFDGVGYEKMAAECPEVLAELKDAIAKGIIEPVGCSYGQPYGLFHGGESNIRQRIYGVRAVMRLLGFRPRTFWEEEFDFFPQLPQILKGCGFEYASLYFQWTWHTPEVPKEDVPVVWWEALDGSRLLTATRNRLNLHQWPEDFQILLDELAKNSPPPLAPEEEGVGGGGLRAKRAAPDSMNVARLPLILQWLELIPSPDWMCRSELMIPMLKKLLADERFEVKMGTLGEYLETVKKGIRSGMAVSATRPTGVSPVDPEPERDAPATHDRDDHSTPAGTLEIPVRRYTMDQVWHGMSLGKNGDFMRRQSFQCESELLSAESLAAVTGLLGRPYAQWDVYPTWELEECWRNLLMAQHHDNDECEGLCGHVGRSQYRTAWNDSIGIKNRQVERVSALPSDDGESIVVLNPLGWDRNWHVIHRNNALAVVNVPALGWCIVPADAPAVESGNWNIEGRVARFRRNSFQVEVDLDRATVTKLANSAFPDGVPLHGDALWRWTGIDSNNEPFRLRGRNRSWNNREDAPMIIGSRVLRLPVEFEGHPEFGFTLSLTCEPHVEGLSICLSGEVPRPKAGMNSSFGWVLDFARRLPRIFVGEPYSVSACRTERSWLRKYPEGDWMTSPQWFETVSKPFAAWCFADFVSQENGHGLLLEFDGARQFFQNPDDSVTHALHMYDPWDEQNDSGHIENKFLFFPHRILTNSERWKSAQEFLRDCAEEPSGKSQPPFGAINCTPQNVLVTAFYREEEYYSGRDLDDYAGNGMGHPFVVRLVEFDGLESEVELTLPGPIAKAFKTNLMGEPERDLTPEKADPLDNRFEWQKLCFKMRPNEIATVYADLVPGRKQVRDLDAKREVWATVHRVGEKP